MALGPNILLAKSYVASGAVNKNAIVELAGDTTVAVATAATDLIIGIALNDAADGERVEVAMVGIAEGRAASGGVADGVMLTAGATGEATAAADQERVIGVSLANAAENEIFPILLSVGAHSTA